MSIINQKAGCAVIGYGGMGGWHTRYLLASDVATLCGIWDTNPAKRDLAKQNGIHVYASEEELLADPAVSVVTICTPNDVHPELAIRALHAGKNVISEKPVALSTLDLERMIQASEETGKLFTVHQNRRWDCDFLMMREAYRSGRLGRVFQIESRIQGSRGVPGDWRSRKPSGGMIFDWGVHLIDQMLQIVDDKKIVSVGCRCTHVTNHEVDDGFYLDVFFEDDLCGHIEVGTHQFVSLPRFFMCGTEGSAVINDWRDTCRCVINLDKTEYEVKPVVTAAGMTKTMAPRAEDTLETYEIPRPDSNVHDYYRNFIAATHGEAKQIVTHAQMRRVLKVMEAAFLSDEAKAVIPFKE